MATLLAVVFVYASHCPCNCLCPYFCRCLCLLFIFLPVVVFLFLPVVLFLGLPVAWFLFFPVVFVLISFGGLFAYFLRWSCSYSYPWSCSHLCPRLHVLFMSASSVLPHGRRRWFRSGELLWVHLCCPVIVSSDPVVSLQGGPMPHCQCLLSLAFLPFFLVVMNDSHGTVSTPCFQPLVLQVWGLSVAYIPRFPPFLAQPHPFQYPPLFVLSHIHLHSHLQNRRELFDMSSQTRLLPY